MTTETPATGYMPKSKSDKWQTPPEVYNSLNEEFKFNFDPCPITWKEGDPDGLAIDWKESNFVNPPYSDVSKWIKKASNEHAKGRKTVMLINAITDTVAFHEYIYNKPNVEVRFIRGRIKFINPSEPAKRMPNVKASMLVIFK